MRKISLIVAALTLVAFGMTENVSALPYLWLDSPDGAYMAQNPDPWLAESTVAVVYLSPSDPFTLIVGTGNFNVQNVHLVVAVPVKYPGEISVDGQTINDFTYGDPDDPNGGYGKHWPDHGVYPTWYNDDYLIGNLGSGQIVELSILWSWSNEFQKIHFDVYGESGNPGWVHNPFSKDVTAITPEPGTLLLLGSGLLGLGGYARLRLRRRKRDQA